MESTLENPAPAVVESARGAVRIAYWIVTALFCLEMSFTAYYELLPQGAQAFARLGFSSGDFRLELSLAKLTGVVVLLAPMLPPRLKEWAYAGFAINLVSAFLAHLSIGDSRLAFVPSMLTGVLWAISYYFWHHLEAVVQNGNVSVQAGKRARGL